MNNEMLPLERALLTRLNQSELKNWLRDYAMPYRELMAYYRCAMMEVETKFDVLNEELSLLYDRNPIESIKSRLKSPESIMDKAARKGIRRMHYSEYKRDYADCETVEGSYDKRTKTIEVMTLVRKGAKATAAKIMPRTSRNGLCPYCHTWCYGDCRA